MKPRWYIGHTLGGYEAFKSAATPTEEEYGDMFKSVIGPFRTFRAVQWVLKHGSGNPHFQCVADAEKLSKL